MLSPAPLITICITHFNDAGFVLNTLYCLSLLTKNPYKVIVRDNNSKGRIYQKLKKGVGDYDNVYLYKAENFRVRGSKAHGIALNDMAKKIDTPYGVILDADFTFLMKNWDEILISRLNNKVKIIGTQISRKGAEGFPFMVGILFETATFRALNIDFRIGDMALGQDTGWQLRGKYQGAGFQGKTIELKNTRAYKQGPFREFLGVGEYYLEGDYDRIFGCHFARGSFLGAAKYVRGTSFIYRLPVIGRTLRRMRGKRDKKKWLKICREIVAQQV